MIDYTEQIAKEDNIKSLQLAVRETQDAAIKLLVEKIISSGVKTHTMPTLTEVLLKVITTIKICSANYTSH